MRKRRVASRALVRLLWAVTLAAALAAVLGWRLLSWQPLNSDLPWQRFRAFEVPPGTTATDVATTLVSDGLMSESRSFIWSQRLLGFATSIDEGSHWLPVTATPQELRLLMTRRSSKHVRVTIPEGWDSFQLAKRLGKLGICDPAAFLRVVFDPETAKTLVGATSLEGYLYPDTYELKYNSQARRVVERLVRTSQQRFDAVFAQNEAALQQLRRLGLNRAGVVNLASIVEKEGADQAEFRLVASVFLNRLRDPRFQPARMLQSDPTAGYGCKLPSAPPSCAGYAGRVRPSMLRDGTNLFNTYRHPGLPPTPIGNPSTAGIDAVLRAPATSFFYFVTKPGGGHHFSVTYRDHLNATKRSPR